MCHGESYRSENKAQTYPRNYVHILYSLILVIEKNSVVHCTTIVEIKRGVNVVIPSNIILVNYYNR